MHASSALINYTPSHYTSFNVSHQKNNFGHRFLAVLLFEDKSIWEISRLVYCKARNYMVL